MIPLYISNDCICYHHNHSLVCELLFQPFLPTSVIIAFIITIAIHLYIGSDKRIHYHQNLLYVINDKYFTVQAVPLCIINDNCINYYHNHSAIYQKLYLHYYSNHSCGDPQVSITMTSISISNNIYIIIPAIPVEIRRYSLP